MYIVVVMIYNTALKRGVIMKVLEKSINLEVSLNSNETLKIVSETGEYFYVVCKDGKLIIKEDI